MGRRLAGELACLAAVAVLASACATGRARTAGVTPGPLPPSPPPAPDPVVQLIERAQGHLEAGMAAADQGYLDRARQEFDRAIDLYLGQPGGAYADARTTDAYRRALELIHVREIEMLAAGDGFTEAGTEPASIDELATLAVEEKPASPESRERAEQAVAAEDPDLPIDLNDAVLSCLELYQGRLRSWFEEALARGHQYLPHIRQVFEEEGIPGDLAYAALVESAFKPNAYSRARARGVWQFISGTGKRYGLQVNWWVDERGDPEKATRAAARYLKVLYDRFGDWNLALAGYNAGEGKVLRAMRRYKTRDFWELRKTRGLRRETKNYVPLIHAAIVLAKAPERYGFSVDPIPPRSTERVAVEGAFDLRVIAECAEAPLEDIRTLNPELRRLATPPNTTFALRVPTGSGPAVSTCLATLPAEKRVRFRTHVVARGQTLGTIARAHGVRARDVAEANGLNLKKRLRIGTELIIPIPTRSKVATAANRAPREEAGEGRSRIRYRIKPGDTLGSIAAHHGTTVREIQAWNKLRGTRIAAGAFLTIYAPVPQD